MFEFPQVFNTLNFEEMVIPLQYMGEKISKKKAIGLLNGPVGRKHQCDGLVYLKEQMPTYGKKNGWKCVINRPDFTAKEHNRKYVIKTEIENGSSSHCNGEIMVHYLPNEDKDVGNIRDDLTSCLANHTEVRKNDRGSGKMVTAGMRVDYASSSATYYTGSNGLDVSLCKYVFRKTSTALNAIIRKTQCKRALIKQLKHLKSTGTGISFRVKDGNHLTVAPTHSISEDLTNPMHKDINDCTRAFAVFLSKVEERPGVSYFLFPSHGIAIQIKGTLVLSWEADNQPHCTCTVVKGVYGASPFLTKRVMRHATIRRAFNTKGYNNNISVGDKIVVRQNLKQLRDMGVLQHTTPDCMVNNRPRKLTYRTGEVVAIEKRMLVINFSGKLQRHGAQCISRRNACSLEYIDRNKLNSIDRRMKQLKEKGKEKRKRQLMDARV